jgi:superfamily II DNA/RNA helicase
MTILNQRLNTKLIIFVKTCKQCHLIHSALKKLDFKTCLLHSFMKQTRRQANLSLFRSGKADILVTTDLASRGLDIKCVDTVINYEIPRKLSDYIHRVGRTARQNREGEAITFVTQHEVQLFLGIEQEVGVKMN